MNYWVSPSGRVWEVECRPGDGPHMLLGGRVLNDKFQNLNFDAKAMYKFTSRVGGIPEAVWYNKDEVREDGTKNLKCTDIIEFLHQQHYIRYSDWMGANGKWILGDNKPTKRQIERMFELTGYIYH